MRKIAVLVLAVLIAAGAAQAAGQATLTVYAAASLTDAFPKIAPSAKFSFAGSNALATQIQKGAPADVFASANMTLPTQLFQKNLCSKPVVFTRNTLVLIVPKSNPAKLHSVYDLRRPGIKLVIAGPGVPVGTYTLQILKNMNLTSVLSNVVSRETDVREVLAKVALGEADAGFVYSTDARTVPGKVTVHQDSGLGAAQGAVRNLHRLVERQQGGGAGVREPGRRQGGPEDPALVRLPAARQEEDVGGPPVKRALLAFLYFGVSAVALAFLALPIVALFVHVPPGQLVHQLSNPVVKDALVVSLKTTLIAQVVILLCGTPLAYLLATRRFAGRPLLVTLVELPLVLPPAVAGIGLLVAFGREGLLGSTLDVFGISIPFTQTAVTIAVIFVASPLYVRQAIAAFEAVDPDLVAASRTLGAGPVRTFFRIVLPLARGGLAAGEALCVRARARRVRRHDHVRRQPAGGDADAAAGDLCRVRRELRRRGRDRRAARRDQRRAADRVENELAVATLSADFTLPLRSFELELRLDVERTVALVGPSGAGKSSVLRAIAGPGPAECGARGPRRRRLARRRRGVSSAGRTSGGSASCSRSTRCSRT